MTRSPHDPHSNRFHVLVVDDSALMRKLIADLVSSSPDLEVIGLAKNAHEAIESAERFKPDIITLDVEMPGKSGLDALPDLLAIVPNAAVIMVSSHTQAGAAITLTALERGAFDFFPKPDRNQLAQIRESRDILVAKLIAAAQAKQHSRARLGEPRLGSGIVTGPLSLSPGAIPTSTHLNSPLRVPKPLRSSETDFDLPTMPGQTTAAHPQVHTIVVGISTGGPQALGKVLPLLSASTPPILIVQHMPPTFTSVFADRLDRACPNLEVREAKEGDKVYPGRILVAPGGRHMEVKGTATNPRISLSDGPAVSSHRPSIDVLFKSAARTFGNTAVGLIMTGMGRDGVDGCKEILSQSGLTFGQDEATSVVYGMNKAAFLEGAIRKQFALEQFPALIKRFSLDR